MSDGPAWADACPVGVVTVADGRVRATNETARELLGERVEGRAIDEAFPTSVEATVPRLFTDGGPTESREFEEYYPELDRWLAVTVAPDEERVRLYLQDVTSRVMANQRADQLTGEVDRLSVVTEVVSDVLGELVEASDRTEVGETICTRLGETERFAFAWLGERHDGELTVRASAGDTGQTFDRIRSRPDATPAKRAVERGELQLVQPIPEDDSVADQIRQAAFADGVQSALAVPLTYGGTTYGVVSVYATSQEAFSDRERAHFATLGRMAGFAVNAARNRSLLFADRVTAVTFEVRDRDAPLVAASAAADATLTVEGVVPDDDQLLTYVASQATPADPLRESLEAHDGVTDVRVVTDRPTGARLELLVGPQSPLRTVSTLGATVGEAVADEGRARITAELPSGEEVRRVAEAIRRRFDADTVAKVQRDRPVTTAEDLRAAVTDRLTERQETALRTAYLAGYFESPRDSTAEEVGEALDITGSTLLHHLRAGQRKVLAAVLDDDARRANEG